MIIKRLNRLTWKVNEMDLDITVEQIQEWQKGALIQEVMPHLSATEREFLISGMSPEEQKEVFR